MMVPEEEVDQTSEQTSLVVVHNWFDNPITIAGNMRDKETALLMRFQFNF